MRILGDISETHNDSCCSSACSAREAPTSYMHKEQRRKTKLHIFPNFFVQYLAMNNPHLQNTFFDVENPQIFPAGPRSSIDPNSSCDCCETRVDLATHRTLVQLPSRIRGVMHRASTLSSELAAPVLSVGRTRPARRSKSLLFTEN